MFFDSHAHYDDPRFSADREALITSLPTKGVRGFINAGSDLQSSKASVSMAEVFSYVWAAVGVHPHEVSEINDETIKEIKNLCSREKVAAVGEIGLDFYYDNSPRDIQRYWFKRQLELAAEAELPVIVHAREATAETLAILRESGVRRGVIHSFSGSAETAFEYIDMGFYIGVGGVVTFDKSKKLPEALEKIPLEYLLLETDAPYQTPVPFRGKRNDSSYLRYIAEAVARIKKTTAETVAAVTYENTKRCFTCIAC